MTRPAMWREISHIHSLFSRWSACVGTLDCLRTMQLGVICGWSKASSNVTGVRG